MNPQEQWLKVPDNLLEERRNSQSQLLWDLQKPDTDLGVSQSSCNFQFYILTCVSFGEEGGHRSPALRSPICWPVIVRGTCHPSFAAPSLWEDADAQLPLTPDLHLAASLRATQAPLLFAFLVFADTRFQAAREDREDSHQSQLLPPRKKWRALITPLRPVPKQTYFLYELMPSDLFFYTLFIIVQLFYQFGGCFVTHSEKFFKQ